MMKRAADNSAAIQALMAIVMVAVTVVLIIITGRYVILTHQIATIMQQQMEASFQRFVDTAITFKAQGKSHYPQSDTVYGHILVENKSAVPLKLVSIKMAVHFKEAPFKDSVIVKDCQNIILYPSRQKELPLIVRVPPYVAKEEPIRKVLLQCTDLTGRSRHTFVISEDSRDTTHYLGFRED